MAIGLNADAQLWLLDNWTIDYWTPLTWENYPTIDCEIKESNYWTIYFQN
jgi:hypothetical protein